MLFRSSKDSIVLLITKVDNPDDMDAKLDRFGLSDLDASLDDGLEDYIRQVRHLPERTTDDRTIDQRRKQQAEQNQPPEPETAAGSDGNDEGEEIPDNVAEAAKRRLGRSGANGNKVHTAKANTQGKDTGQSRSPTQT